MSKGPISASALKRSNWVAIIIFAIFAALLIRVLYIQTVDFEKYQTRVINQMTTQSRVPADRGRIYDRNGNVLATNITTYRVFISPSGIKMAQEELEEGKDTNYAMLISEGLSEILGVSYDEVYKQATEYTKYLDRTIKRKVYEADADRVRVFIDEHELQDMIYLEAQSTRYYPGSTLAAHVLGFTGSDGVGMYGLELQYNEYLKGIDGYYIKARDSYGKEMPYDYASYIDAIDGYNLNTTIDTSIQSFLEEQLEATVIDHEAENRACGIVVDVKSGAILAMATSSPFDLNNYATLDEDALYKLKRSGYEEGSAEYAAFAKNLREIMWSNKAVTESYIPGSTFKIITSSMALEENKVSLSESVNCPGYMTVFGHKIHCHKVTGHGSLLFAEGLQQSCNVWFMTLGERLGIENYQKYVKTFGYKEQSGIDLPGEGYSIFSSSMTDLDLAIYAFGQNFNVTPIQHIMAIASVANGGNLMEPYIVESITDNSGNIIYKHTETVKRSTVSQEVCETIAQMLEEGVSGNGGAKNAYVAGYRVAAKTGTAEKKERECPRCEYADIVAVEGKEKTTRCKVCGYEGPSEYFEVSDKYICSTIAFAPADDPEVAIIIMVDEPTKGVLYGSTVAAPYVSKALEKIMVYLGVEAEYTEEEMERMAVKVGSYKGWSVSAAVKNIEKLGYSYEIVGGDSGVISAQSPAAGTYVEKGSAKIVLYVKGNEPTPDVLVPDLTGRTAAAANQTLINLGLNVKIEGTTHYLSGINTVVYSQSIPAGTAVAKGTVVTLNFRSMDGDEEPEYDG